MRRPCICLLLLVPTLAAAAQIPELHWTPRSDWINVQQDVVPKAIGDGQADDTAAIQAALDALSSGKPTVYFPPGQYRITRTLVLLKKDGIALVGHGRSTILVWDGPAGDGDDSRMLWCNGAPRSRFAGLTWDGNHKAHVGFDHDSKTLFETEIDHENEAFIHFTGSGLRVGHNQAGPGAMASAETTITNCLFADCAQGASVLTFNDYNFTFSYCHFSDCGTAIYGGKGSNLYARDCRFERSRVRDVHLRAEHACSVRRCVSEGSEGFLDQDGIAPLTVQDCQVAGWRRSPAILLSGAPVILFDCVFSQPPDANPPIRAGRDLPLVLSNNQSFGTQGLIELGKHKPTEIPAGQEKGALRSAQERFLPPSASVGGRVFDARRDFGASGDGRADDTTPVQQAIDAAQKAGNDAVAYLPAGDYAITRTLTIGGANYRIAGAGTHTRLNWHGRAGGTLMHVQNPDHLTIQDLDVGSSGQGANAVDILQTADGPCSVRYHRVWVFGMYRKKPGEKGMLFEKLPPEAVTIADHVNGNLRFSDCARATFLLNSSYEGAIVVEGKNDAARDGLLGFQTRLATINQTGLILRDSQSIIMSDYYVESADRLMELEGSAGDPPGRATIQMVKSHCANNPVIAVRNYQGQMVLGPAMFYPGGVNPAQMVQSGDNAFSLTLMATQAYRITPSVKLDHGRLILLQNQGSRVESNVTEADDLTPAARALDDLRRLGALDLRLNRKAP